eukprot:CAMPEP_0202856110 /NCGR_PEP_ID=MMETSP1389-20130828/91864_1 /ASSEMBLY_ACC=CAM_ASM_000865 /TAXON_ID=302021 /ORGANISM="Rhodomonas sp., Strain CCMP768" /LENGTH=161 /DNA_ID=CAMNT_0049534751 /DNA_START=559 /DNA_END=1044 /DNA_ORIENTATION=+
MTLNCCSDRTDDDTNNSPAAPPQTRKPNSQHLTHRRSCSAGAVSCEFTERLCQRRSQRGGRWAACRERAGRGRDESSTASAEAEVRKFEHSMVIRQHQVCWLEIAVHDARLDPMQERQRIKELDGPRQSLVQRNSAPATEERHTTLEEVFEVSTFHELQNK